jgi:predicted nucleic acid-binding protein
MILVDTGPLVTLFEPKDAQHERCKNVLRAIQEPLITTIPVLTEGFHMLSPSNQGADRLRDSLAERDYRCGLWMMLGLSVRSS